MSVEAALARCCCSGFPTTECFQSFRGCFGLPLPQTVSISVSCQLEYNCSGTAPIDEESSFEWTQTLLISASMSLTGTLDDPNSGYGGGFIAWPRYILTGTATRNYYQAYTGFPCGSSESYSLSVPNVTGYLSCGRTLGTCLPGWIPGMPAYITSLIMQAGGQAPTMVTRSYCGETDTVEDVLGTSAYMYWNACGNGPVPCVPDPAFSGTFGSTASIPNTLGVVGGIEPLSAVGFTTPPDGDGCPTIYSGSYTITFS